MIDNNDWIGDKMSNKRIRVEGITAKKEFADFMAGEKIYEFTLSVENPKTGDIFDIPIVYSQATAFDIMTIYADLDPKDSVEVQFDYTMQLFNFCIDSRCGIRFVNVPKGTANYLKGEISMQDLLTDQKMIFERLVAPGTGKSDLELKQQLKAASRKVGKRSGNKDSFGMAETPDAGVSL